jgi:hypothetical protein
VILEARRLNRMVKVVRLVGCGRFGMLRMCVPARPLTLLLGLMLDVWIRATASTFGLSRICTYC